MSTDESIAILLVAVPENIAEFVHSFLSNAKYETIDSEDELDEKYENFGDDTFAFAICGAKLGPSFSNEVAQVLNCQCPSMPTFFVTEDKNNFAAQDLVKNGFFGAFLYPMNKEQLKEKIISSAGSESLSQRHFKRVQIIDIGEGDELPFDTHVFLPLNNKFVHFSTAKEKFSDKKLDKLEKHHIGSIHIDQKDADAFYSYSANRLKNIGQSDSMSATEKEEKLRAAISGLFIELFDSSKKSTFESGKEMMASCQKIVSNYITGGTSNDWYSNLIRTVGGEKGGFPHSSEVSTLAALFALGIQHPNPEDLALAGFLHDVSLADFPEDQRHIPVEEMPEELRKVFLNHPQESVNRIKSMKMVINENIEKSILEHHEMFNGKGFPKAKSGDRISREAQILSYANQFQEITSTKPGQKRINPTEAHDIIAKNGSIGPELLRSIKALFTANS